MKIVVLALTLAALSLISTPGSTDAFATPSTRVVVTAAAGGTRATTLQTASVLFVSDSSNNENNNNNEEPIINFSVISDAANRAMEELPKYDASQVQNNLQQGELGKRGEVYFAAQAALIVCILADGIPLVGDPVRIVLGPLILLAGLATALLSIVDLGSDSLSPFPKPTEDGALKTSGLYAQMRHPMYTALLCVMLGVSLVTDSADRLLLTGLLWYLLEVKSDKEEVFLMDRFGGDYADYKTQVPEKFLPMALSKILPWTD